MMKYKLWINGKACDAVNGEILAVENPATGEIIDSVPDAGKEDVDLAVAAAKSAFDDGRWSKKTPAERSAVLSKMADIIEARSDEIARIESEDTGKPFDFVSLGGDIPFAVDNLRFFAAAARDIKGSASGEYAQGYTSILRNEPWCYGWYCSLELPIVNGDMENWSSVSCGLYFDYKACSDYTSYYAITR